MTTQAKTTETTEARQVYFGLLCKANQPPTIPGTLAAGIIQVCAWCYPGESIFKAFPNYAGLGLQISHGICPVCKARELAKLSRG